MEYQSLVKDFALRTRKNLEAVREIQRTDPDKVYEVTQLINSMLGLLVFPQQKYFDNIPSTPIAELKKEGWPVPQVIGVYPDVIDLRELLRYLRNAAAHFNLEFDNDDRGQIAGLRVWNTNPRTQQITWMACLSVGDLEAITDKFVALILVE
jgi:hypothetical protein